MVFIIILVIGLFALLFFVFVGSILGLIHFIITYPEKKRKHDELITKHDTALRNIDIKHLIK